MTVLTGCLGVSARLERVPCVRVRSAFPISLLPDMAVPTYGQLLPFLVITEKALSRRGGVLEEWFVDEDLLLVSTSRDQEEETAGSERESDQPWLVRVHG